MGHSRLLGPLERARFLTTSAIAAEVVASLSWDQDPKAKEVRQVCQEKLVVHDFNWFHDSFMICSWAEQPHCVGSICSSGTCKWIELMPRFRLLWENSSSGSCKPSVSMWQTLGFSHYSKPDHVRAADSAISYDYHGLSESSETFRDSLSRPQLHWGDVVRGAGADSAVAWDLPGDWGLQGVTSNRGNTWKHWETGDETRCATLYKLDADLKRECQTDSD